MRGARLFVAASLGALLLVSVAGAASAPITEFSVLTAGSYPQAITAGPDGNLWYVELGGAIGRITPAGVVTEFPVPKVDGNGINAIAAGPDGNIWFTSKYGVGKITVTGNQYTYMEYATGAADGGEPRSIVAGPDGRMWFADDGFSAGWIDAITTSGQVTSYKTGIQGFPYGIAAGPDGNIWFTTPESVGKITTGGDVTQYTGLTGMPEGITAGPDGNLWVAENGDLVAKITTNGTVTEYRVGPADGTSGPSGIAAGPDGNLWFTGGYTADNVSGDRIGKITTAGVVTDYLAGISPQSGPVGIVAGADGNIWFTEYSGGRIGRLDLHAATPTPTPTPKPTPAPKDAVTVVAAVRGKGSVTGGGISCPTRCTARLTGAALRSGYAKGKGETVVLIARASKGYRFAGWSGACPPSVEAAIAAPPYSTCKLAVSLASFRIETFSDGFWPRSFNVDAPVTVTAIFVRR